MNNPAGKSQLKCKTCGREVGILRSLMQHEYCCEEHRLAAAEPAPVAMPVPPPSPAPAESAAEPIRRIDPIPARDNGAVQNTVRDQSGRFLTQVVNGALPMAAPLPLRFQLQTFPRVPVILDERRG